jgi:betaine-aldehyde dehydrogenase
VDAAVQSARRCFEHDPGAWSEAGSLARRTAAMRSVARRLREPDMLRALANLEALDCGKPLAEAEADMLACADYFDYFAEIAPGALATEELATGSDEPFRAALVKEPVGVVGCVTPWNYPLMQAVLKVAPAVAAGCCVVLKPAPNASLSCLALGEICADAGFPAGALNVVTGGPPDVLAGAPGGESTGQALIDHPGLDKLSFTGSGAAGKAMLTASAPHLRPTSLELGGKSPAVVFDDAREIMPALVDWLMVGIFCTTGQICSATSRLVVEASLHDELVAQLTQAAARLRVGDPLAPDTQMGPLVSRAQQRSVEAAVDKAAAQGATVTSPPTALAHLRGGALGGGFYVPPTVLTDVPLDSDAWVEEIFGPVLCVSKFTTEDEAVAMANATDFGLAAAVFSSDAQRCASVASRLQAGVVWQNCSQVLFNTTPFGGRKKSGFGHELGLAGLEEYVAKKSVVEALDGYSWEWYGEVSQPNK